MMQANYRLLGTMLAGVMLSSAALAADQPNPADAAPVPAPAASEPPKLICTKVTPVGSLMPVKRCVTPAQQQRDKEAVARFMREQSARSPTAQSPN